MIVETLTSVSYRYYEKRNRHVAEQNIASMCRALNRPIPPMPADKHALIKLALKLHSELPA